MKRLLSFSKTRCFSTKPMQELSGAHAKEPFIFDNSANVFTEDQVSQYNKDGYLVIKNLLSQEEIDRYVNRFVAIANGEVKRDISMIMMRDVSVAKEKTDDGKKKMGDMAITKIQEYMRDEVLSTYPKLPQLTKYMNALLGPNLRACHTMIINKPPDSGEGSSRHPPHQDLWYFTFRPINRIAASWTALQNITSENGGLFILPGSHVLPLQNHSYPTDGVVNKGYFGIQHMAEEKYEENMVHLSLGPGDTVLFHPLLVHGSSRNRSGITRKAISCHFAASECDFVDVSGEIQEKMVAEMTDMIKQRGGDALDGIYKSRGYPEGVTWENIWRHKSGLVTGVDVNYHKPVN